MAAHSLYLCKTKIATQVVLCSTVISFLKTKTKMYPFCSYKTSSAEQKGEIAVGYDWLLRLDLQVLTEGTLSDPT